MESPPTRTRQRSSFVRTIQYSIVCLFCVVFYNIYRLHIHYLHPPLHDEGYTYHDLLYEIEETVEEAFINVNAGQDEAHVFSQLMKRVMANQDQCGLQDHLMEKTSSNLTSTPMNKMTLKAALNAVNEQNREGKHETCYLPPNQICADEYTTIISYHYSNSSHRTLFVNLISLLARDSIKPSTIVLIYHGTLDDLKNDNDYGRRVWNWDKEGAIKLINGTNSDHGILHQFHPTLLNYVETEIILYLDGSMPLTKGNVDKGIGGVDSLEAGFELIQQNSRSLVGAHVYEYGGKQNIANFRESLKDSRGDFIPACQSNHSISGSMQDSIVHYSGMFLHKNYICFIWHDIFETLRDTVNMINRRYQKDVKGFKSEAQSELISLFISSMVPQLSGNIPALYPLLKPSWAAEEIKPSPKKQSRRLMENIVLDDDELEARADLRRRRRTEWVVNTNDIEAAYFEGHPRRRLSSVINMAPKPSFSISLRSQLSSEEISSIFSYFGSYSKGSKCWCESADGKSANLAPHFLNCRDRCSEGRNITKTELPWLRNRKQCH